MKKLFLLATAAMLVCTATFAEGGKGGKNKKKCAKSKTCSKGGGCCKDKAEKTAKM